MTVQDLAFERLPAAFDRRFAAYARRAHRAAARGADAVVCPSLATARDLRARWGIPPERIVRAPYGPGQFEAADAAPAAQPRHFLYVGDDEPRKNVALLLEAHRRYRDRTQAPLELVLAGGARAEAAGVRLESHPDRARLAELLAAAAALVHPSLHEGFGLTPLEAMTLGTPVIAGRVPGVVECCGEAVRYADPRDADSFADALAELAADGALRERLAGRGRERAAGFSWAASARAHMAAYRLTLA